VALGGTACLTAVVKDIHVIIIEVKKTILLDFYCKSNSCGISGKHEISCRYFAQQIPCADSSYTGNKR